MSSKEAVPNEKKFTANWWEHTFLRTTNSFTKAAVFEDCLPKKETQAMRANILDILRTQCKLKTTLYGFRVYVEGRQLTAKELNRIYNSPPKDIDSLTSWAQRTFGNQKFGIIINRAENLNNELAKRMAHKISPLLKKAGTPLLGINFTFFIGNYGWTPIGIHQDDPGESVIHFHLGPGEKTMYTWNEKKYKKLAGKNKANNKDEEKFLPYANVHLFKEGDLFYMPPNVYHIGKSDNLSVGLTLWFNNKLKSELAIKLLKVVEDQYLEGNTETMLPDKNGIEDLSASRQAIDLFKLPKDLENLPFKIFMKEIFKIHKYALSSNSGYCTSPLPKKKQTEFSIEDHIMLEKPFVIKYVDSLGGKNLLIFIRGAKLVLLNFEGIKSLIDEINKGKKVSVKYLLSLLDKDWNEDIGIFILNLIDTHYGIRKV
ncbi:hypothetical protein [Pricia sp.]|uniref:hypothetical protein n=1 Tax=Pricia sp. TaxID=2268138 RepID=UPI00359366CC